MNPPSNTPKAIAARLRRLHDPEWAEKTNAARRRYYARKRAHDLSKMTVRYHHLVPSTAMAARVRMHLAKGRDVGDIAVRERLKVTEAKRIVAHVLAVQRDGAAQDSLAPGNGGRA